MATTDLTDVAGARDAVEDAARTARKRLDGARSDLLDLAGSARGELTDRASVARDQLRDRIDEVDLEPTVRRAQIGFWAALRAVIGALVTVPGAAVRGLGTLSDVADDAVDRGSELSARSRQLAQRVPVTPRQRARARRRTQTWTVGGFVVGVIAGGVGGYLLARREPDLLDDARDAAWTGTQRARELGTEQADRARSVAGDVAERAKTVAGDAAGRAKTAVADAKASGAAVDSVVSDATGAAHDAVDAAEAATVEAIADARDAADDGADQAEQTAHRAAEQAHDVTDAVADGVTSDNGDAGSAAAKRGTAR